MDLRDQDRFTLLRLMNPNGAAEGSNLAPKQVGQFRVPFVTNFRLVRTTAIGTQTQFTLTWDNPTDPTISHYAVYIILSTSPAAPPLGPFNTQASPAQVTIPTTGRVKVTFVVQTVLNNGMVSSFENSPTCAGETTEPAKLLLGADATLLTIDTILIPANTTIALETIIVGRLTFGPPGTNEDGARFKLSAVYKTLAGVVTLIGVVTKLADKDEAAWDANFVISSNTVLVQVNGAVGTNVSWKATTVTYSVSVT